MIHLSEAVARRSVGKYDGLDNFPDKPDIMKIKAFLDMHGFEDYTKKGALTETGLMLRCKNNSSRGYKMGPCDESGGTWWIKFGDAHKVFMFRDENYNKLTQHKHNPEDMCRITYGRGNNDSYDVDFEKCRLKAIKYFDWEKTDVTEAVAKRTTGKYSTSTGDIKGLPDRPDLKNVGNYMEVLERNGFVWLPKKIDISAKNNLTKEFGRHRRYTSEGVTEDRDGNEFPLRFAFGDGRRVYRLYVVEQHKPTNYIRYQFDIQRSDGIVVDFLDYNTWLESAIKFFGLE